MKYEVKCCDDCGNLKCPLRVTELNDNDFCDEFIEIIKT